MHRSGLIRTAFTSLLQLVSMMAFICATSTDKYSRPRSSTCSWGSGGFCRPPQWRRYWSYGSSRQCRCLIRTPSKWPARSNGSACTLWSLSVSPLRNMFGPGWSWCTGSTHALSPLIDILHTCKPRKQPLSGYTYKISLPNILSSFIGVNIYYDGI